MSNRQGNCMSEANVLKMRLLPRMHVIPCKPHMITVPIATAFFLLNKCAITKIHSTIDHASEGFIEIHVK